jgi:competence protein ComEC
MKTNYSALALLAVIGGILTGVLASGLPFDFQPLYWLLLGLVASSGALVSFVVNRFKHPAVGWLALVFFFCSGGFLFSLARSQYRNELNLNRSFAGQTIQLEGVLIQRVAPTTYGYRFVIRVAPSSIKSPSGKITVYCQEPLPASWYGHRVRIRGKFKPVLLNSATARGVSPDFYERNRITGTLSLTGEPVLLPGLGLSPFHLWANQIREAFISRGNAVLSPSNAKLLHGMLFNDEVDDEANSEIVVDMRRTGTIHLLSVSGLHIGFVALLFNLIFGALKIPKKWRILPLIAGIGMYILMTGMEPPVLRAGIMILIFSVAELLGTNDNNLNRLSLAALILLWYNPSHLFEIGFQLSFLAMLGVVWVFPTVRDYFTIKPRWVKPVWEAILVSLAAQSMVTPVIVNNFQQISWISPLVNLLILIPAELIVIGGLIGEMIGLVLPWVGGLILTGVDWTIYLTRWILSFFGGQPWSASWVPVWPWPWVIGYYVGIDFLLDWLRPNLLTNKRTFAFAPAIIGLLVCLNLIVWTAFVFQSQHRYLEIAFLDVGQGDSIFMKTPDGSTTLIDSGNPGMGQRRILPYLWRNGIDHLDQVIVTHGHLDHLGGMAEVLAEIPVRRLYLPPDPVSETMSKFLSSIGKLHLKGEKVKPGMKLNLGPGLVAEIMEAAELTDENDRSLVMLVHYGKYRLLFASDLGFEGEDILMQENPSLLQAEVLKVGHHGSNQASSLEFLAQVKPGVAIISVGAGNDFGHPGKETLNRLKSVGARIWRTDISGEIDLRVYEERIMLAVGK